MGNLWQSILDAHWLWAGLVWLLPIAAAVVLAWALFRDRPGLWGVPRERCPKCRYDMTNRGEAAGGCEATPGIVCPECGKTIRDERMLRKTRRRWGMALLAVPLLVGMYLAMNRYQIRRHGWLAVVPTPAMMVAIDPQDWFDLTAVDRQYLQPTTAAGYLHRGLMRHDTLMKIWLWRVGGLLKDEGVRVIDATKIVPLSDPDPRTTLWVYRGGQYPPPTAGLNDHDAMSLAGFAMQSIDPSAWVEQGGEWHEMRRAGSYLLPRATPNVVDAIEELVSVMEATKTDPASPLHTRIHGHDIVVVSMGYFSDTDWYRTIERDAIDFAYHAEMSSLGGGAIMRTAKRGNIIEPERYGRSEARHRIEESISEALMHETNTDFWVHYGGEFYFSYWIGELLVVCADGLGTRGFEHGLERIRDLGPDAILKEHGVEP